MSDHPLRRHQQIHPNRREPSMTHRTDAVSSIIAARDTLAEIQGQRTTTDVTIANATRAQAIATAAVAQAILALADALEAGHQPSTDTAA